MKHFYQDIEGRFDFLDIYSAAVKAAPPNAVFVEVGCWQGRSTAYLATEILNSGKKIMLHVVDNFSWLDGKFRDSDHLYQTFLKNIRPVLPVIRVYRQNSCVPIPGLANIDFVYIDGGHSYNAVKQDILHHIPLMRPGGVIAGHDYERKRTGVRQAVAECFGFDYYTIMSSWVHICR